MSAFLQSGRFYPSETPILRVRFRPGADILVGQNHGVILKSFNRKRLINGQGAEPNYRHADFQYSAISDFSPFCGTKGNVANCQKWRLHISWKMNQTPCNLTAAGAAMYLKDCLAPAGQRLTRCAFLSGIQRWLCFTFEK